ncbi:hypothetical protein P154DRAFT_623862 [Amniculicola lignicola CBS 123094]|uniref:Uncharacterized protein n=1 Tax=Amniculicola lignicola CBS 123094 TaxID=1392246 RepID=A0A6A5W1I0_9PLEO|nr:hypothetical protein P154DRAFT_623862 [Amniculicola lignicola CBS 123094]
MSKSQDHIPVNNPTDEEPEQKGTGGLLSPLGDPLGSALETSLSPLGAGLSKITGPVGNALGGTTRGALGPLMGEKDEKMEVVGGNNKDSYEHKAEKIAGKEQTGQNPLGLDETGRWGFREE